MGRRRVLLAMAAVAMPAFLVMVCADALILGLTGGQVMVVMSSRDYALTTGGFGLYAMLWTAASMVVWRRVFRAKKA